MLASGVLICWITLAVFHHSKAQLTFISDCQSLSQVRYYDVTSQTLNVDSHDNYDFTFEYDDSTHRCMSVYTNTTDHVIKLDEKQFALEDSFGFDGSDCFYDVLQIYDGAMNSATINDLEGTYCGNDGPGTFYSEGQGVFLYFKTDSLSAYRGFRISASSLHKDDVPIQLSGAAIAGIVIGCIVFVVIIGVVIFCIIQHKNNKRGRVHNTQGQRTTVVTTQQMRHVPPPRPMAQPVAPPAYQQHQAPPPAYKPQQGPPPPNYLPPPQPTGSYPPPPVAQDPAYPPPAALYPPAPTS